MFLKLLSVILVTVYSTTTLITYPHQSVFALRTPSVKCSSAGNEDGIAGELTGQQGEEGPFSITTACWKEFLALQDNGYRSAPLWDKFALATETVDDVTFLNAVFGRFTEYLPGLVKQGVERSVQRARELLPAMEKVPPKADRKTVNIVATKDGFALAEAETPVINETPAEVIFNVPAPDAAPEEWQACIDGVRNKDEFAAIKEAFKAYTLPPKEKRNVAGIFTIAAFWVNKGKNPKTHKLFEEVQPSAAAPAETKSAGIPDDKLAALGVPVKDIKSRSSSMAGDEAIITRAGNEQAQLFVVGKSGELLCKGPFSGPEDGYALYINPDRSLFILVNKEKDAAYVYKTDASSFNKPYRQFNNLGQPAKTAFSDNGKLAVFGFSDDRADVVVDIEANRVVMELAKKEPVGYIPDEVSPAAAEIREQIKNKQRLADSDDILRWLNSAGQIRPVDLIIFDDILLALDKSNQIPGDKKDPLSKKIAEAQEIARQAVDAAVLGEAERPREEVDALAEAAKAAADAAGITLVSGVSGKEAAQKAAESSGEIEIADYADASGSSSAITLEEEEPEPSAALPTETPESVLEQAKRKIALARSVKELRAIVLEFLQHELIRGSEGLKQELNAATKIRKDELGTLNIISLRLDDAFNSGTVHLEQGYSLAQANGGVKKSIEGCLKESYNIFKAAADTEKILQGLEINRSTALFKEATGLIIKKRELFKVWARLVMRVESAYLNATTFSELKAFADELEKRFGSSTEYLAVPKILIEKRKAVLEGRQKAALEKIGPLAAIVAQEYAWLISHFDHFKEALKELEAEAKKAKFESLKHAADEAVDDLYVKVQDAGGRLETRRMVYSGKWRRWQKLRPLKKSLKELVAKRKSLIGQLKLYLEAKRAILDNFKPQDLALAENEKGKLAELVDAAVVEIMKDRNMKQDYPGITEQYLHNKAYRFRGIARLIADSDRIYLRQLCKKLGIKEKDFKVITNDTFRIVGTVDLAKFMDRHGPPLLAAQTSALEKKFLLTIDSRA